MSTNILQLIVFKILNKVNQSLEMVDCSKRVLNNGRWSMYTEHLNVKKVQMNNGGTFHSSSNKSMIKGTHQLNISIYLGSK